MDDAEKIRAFDRITAIVADHRALLQYQQATGATFDEVRNGNVWAYREIVEIVTGKRVSWH